MTADYKPHHPEHYPIGWLTATKLAAERPGQDYWVSVDWARGEFGAVARMKRLRAFHKGLFANRFAYPELAAAFTAGYALTFRKRLVHGAWDVQLSWKEADNRQETLMALRSIAGEDVAGSA